VEREVRKVKEQVGVTTGKFVAGLIIAILVSCAVSAVVCPCASAASMWSKTYGGTGTDTGWGDIVQTSDGGYAISGDTASFGAGGSDYWLIKADADGNMQWNKTYGGSLAESDSDMCQTSDGGYALGGYTNSFGAGSNDYWLVKTDAAGNMQWNQTYGGTGTDYGYSVVQTSDGGYAITGITNSYGAGDTDFWLVKTDAAGNMQWNQTYGGTGTELGHHMIQTVEGGYAITGGTQSFGAGSIDFWLVKTDAAGNMQWNQTYGGTNEDDGWSLIQTSDGGYAIAGGTYSFGAGGVDFYVVKTDELGVVPEGLTVGVMVLLSTVAVVVGVRYFRKRPKIENCSQVKL
jgi:predicted secreted protein